MTNSIYRNYILLNIFHANRSLIKKREGKRSVHNCIVGCEGKINVLKEGYHFNALFTIKRNREFINKIKMRKKTKLPSVGGLLLCRVRSGQSWFSGRFFVCSAGAFGVSDLLLDEGVLQGLVDGDALGRVQHQGAVQHVLQQHHFLPLVLGQPLASYHVHQQVFGGVDGAHHGHLLLSGAEKQEVKLNEK